MTTRHEFLAMLHDLVKPKVYLEIGVHTGTSLNLAHAAEVAIGVDPNPLCGPKGNQVIHAMTSDDYFKHTAPLEVLDMAFIDGMHLSEYALRDFTHIDMWSDAATLVVFDDVLPRNREEAAREQCPGDWTGDVWKVPYVVRTRPDLTVLTVRTEPTGTAIVYTNPLVTHSWMDQAPSDGMEEALERLQGMEVPEQVLRRLGSISPDAALDLVTEMLELNRRPFLPLP